MTEKTIFIECAASPSKEEERVVSGIALPYNITIMHQGQEQRHVKGSIVPRKDRILRWMHDEPIGVITELAEGEEHATVSAKISKTKQGDDAYTLLKDGVIKKFSIGFVPLEMEFDEKGVVTYTKIDVKEVSLVPFPAYEGADILEVRSEEESTTKEVPMDQQNAQDLTEVRSLIEELDRKVETGLKAAAPVVAEKQYKTTGELLKAIVAKDELATRAYEGAITSDTVMQDSWIGNLTEIITAKRPIMETFSKGAIPATGQTVEFAELDSDTTQIGIQAAEGDDLLFGKVSVTSRTAAIKTLGGWSSMSVQAIERASIPFLNTVFEGMAEKYGRASEAYVRSVLETALTTASSLTVDLTTQDGVVAAILDLAEAYETAGRSLDGLFVSKDVYKALYAVPATDRILQVSGQPLDKVGSLTVTTGSGSISGLEFRLLPNASAGTAFAYDKRSIQVLESPVVRLQDSNIVSLTRDFSLYGYLCAAVVRPSGLVVLGDAS